MQPKLASALGPGQYEGMGWIDSHSHLADKRLDPYRDSMLAASHALGIDQHLQGGVGPEDWHQQLKLKAQYPGLLPCFGLHPYWVADHSADECEEALSELAKLTSQCLALGEMGLDYRPTVAKGSEERQLDIFEGQLELAKVAAKPIVLHVVNAFPEAIKLLTVHGVPERKGLVHSFNGNWQQAQQYLNLGLSISVGGPLVREQNKKLHEVITKIPLERLLLETDSPDQPPPSRRGQLNSPETLLEVADMVARLTGQSRNRILDQSSLNLRRLLSMA